jgi:hypothetical protein
MAKPSKTLSDGQRAYETKRAAKAGMSLDKWLESKQRQQEIEARARDKATIATVKPAKKPGFFGRLLERAHKPL